jgi:hypothetical protein
MLAVIGHGKVEKFMADDVVTELSIHSEKLSVVT